MKHELIRDLLTKPDEEKIRFYNWFHLYFIYTPKSPYGLPYQHLHAIFEKCYPGTDWTIDNTEITLRVNGLLKTGFNTIPVTTNVGALPDDIDMIRAFIAYEPNPITGSKLFKLIGNEELREKLEKKRCGTVEQQHILEAEDQLSVFYDKWCVRPSIHPILSKMDNTWHKCPIGKLIKAYEVYCKENKCKSVKPMELREYVEHGKGHKKSKGYACKQSGCTYLTDLYVPGMLDQKEINMSASANAIVIYVEGTYYDKYGNDVDIQEGFNKGVTIKEIVAQANITTGTQEIAAQTVVTEYEESSKNLDVITNVPIQAQVAEEMMQEAMQKITIPETHMERNMESEDTVTIYADNQDKPIGILLENPDEMIPLIRMGMITKEQYEEEVGQKILNWPEIK